MSLVIAIKCKDGVLLGADSAVVLNEDRSEILECASNAKIWIPKENHAEFKHPLLPTPEITKIRNTDLLMGIVGTVRDMNVVKSQLCIQHHKLDVDTVVDEVVPEIRNILIQNGFLSDNKPYNSMESSFILASKDSLFVIGYDYSVVEKKNVAVIGYCENEAKNLIDHLVENDNLDEITIEEAKSIITSVITNCSKSCNFVSLPIYFSKLDK